MSFPTVRRSRPRAPAAVESATVDTSTRSYIEAELTLREAVRAMLMKIKHLWLQGLEKRRLSRVHTIKFRISPPRSRFVPSCSGRGTDRETDTPQHGASLQFTPFSNLQRPPNTSVSSPLNSGKSYIRHML